MAYTDFPYYQESFLGNLIRDPTEFSRAAARASEYMDMVTFGRLLEGISEAYTDRTQSCCCALAEAIYTYQAYGTGKTNPDGTSTGAKVSESISKYSVSYASPTESISALLDGGTSGLQNYLKSICMRYLGATGLLYRGCD